MTFNDKDAAITAFALGELSQEEQDKLEQSQEDQAAFIKEVEEMAALAQLLSTELKKEPQPQLESTQRSLLQDSIQQHHGSEPKIGEPESKPEEESKGQATKDPFQRWAILGSLSSVAVLIAIFTIFTTTGRLLKEQPELMYKGPTTPNNKLKSRLTKPGWSKNQRKGQLESSPRGKNDKSVEQGYVTGKETLKPKLYLGTKGTGNGTLDETRNDDGTKRAQTITLQQGIKSKEQRSFETHSGEMDLPKANPASSDKNGFHLSKFTKRENKGLTGKGERLRLMDRRLEKPHFGLITDGKDTNKTNKDGDGRKGKKGRTRKVKPKAWKRTPKGTVLSKVSVGGGKFLKLKKLRITVEVQGPRVRTVMDHIYQNPYSRQLQGTFKYTLPSDASVSYYAMFVGKTQRTPRFFGRKVLTGTALAGLAPRQVARQVKRSSPKDWGILREARLVPAEKGRKVFEDITRRRIDPALLQQDAPGTFSGKVFPIPSKGHNRVIIAYEQTLPEIAGKQLYRFAFPQGVAESIDFTIQHDKKKSALSQHNLRKIRCAPTKGKTSLRCFWEKNKPDRDALFYFAPKNKKIVHVAGMDPVDKARYLFAQLRVKLPNASQKKGTSQGIFLLDTSLSERPAHFAANVSLLKQILEKNKGLKRFNILTFDSQQNWLNPKGWIANTPKERKKVFSKIDKILLEGATDLSGALNTLTKPKWAKAKTPIDVFLLSDGQLTWGNRQVEGILAKFNKNKSWGRVRMFAYQLGLGAENTALYRLLAKQGGGVFQCLGRGELPRCAVAHTKPVMHLDKVTINGIDAFDTLISGRQSLIYPNALLTLSTRYKKDAKATITLHGEYLGKKMSLSYSTPVKASGELAARAWGELAVQQLLGLQDPKYTKLVVAYSQHFRIPNKHCSFLVLETDKEYKQYGLQQQQLKLNIKKLSAFIDKVLKHRTKLPGPKTRWEHNIRKALKRSGKLRTSVGRSVLSLLYALPESTYTFKNTSSSELWLKSMVSKKYRKNRLRRNKRFDPFINEAKRRMSQFKTADAIRALSSITELHPTDHRALRLVGYYLQDWGQSASAAELFLKVLERRSYEPNSFRDLARTMVKMKRFGLAAMCYEIILASSWNSRFGRVKRIAREEYALMTQQALKRAKIHTKTRSFLVRRKAQLGLNIEKAKMRVTLTWNTDNTDIDLWITEPTGEKCGYDNKKTGNGGHLLEDLTGGFGPERYQNKGGKSGRYDIKLKYYSHNTNTFGNETHASVVIVLHPGTDRQKIIEKNVVLRKAKDEVLVYSIKL